MTKINSFLYVLLLLFLTISMLAVELDNGLIRVVVNDSTG